MSTSFYLNTRLRMRPATILLQFLSFLICLLGNQAYAGQDQAFKSPGDKIQYAIGVEVARNFKNNGMEINIDLVMKGMMDGLSNKKLMVSENELRGILISVQSDIRRKRSFPKKASADDNLKVEDSIN